MRGAAEAGIGLAILPTYLGDQSPKLVRLETDVSHLTTGLWILTHPDLVRSARVNAFVGYFSEALGQPATA